MAETDGNKSGHKIQGGFYIMERHAFAMKVKNGQMNAYRTRLGEIWKDLTAFLDRNR